MGVFRRNNPPARQEDENFIYRLCRESGRWRVVAYEGDRYQVCADDGSKLQPVGIRYQPGMASVGFQSRYSVRFSLEKPPSGLFGRLLMRNFRLIYASWSLVIDESCEGVLWVVARVPMGSLNVKLFDLVCREIRDEIVDFHRELTDKFHYSVDGVVPSWPRVPADEIRYTEVGTALPSTELLWRQLAGDSGSVRYRLPAPRE